eukprot:Pgem_evm1s15799
MSDSKDVNIDDAMLEMVSQELNEQKNRSVNSENDDKNILETPVDTSSKSNSSPSSPKPELGAKKNMILRKKDNIGTKTDLERK